MEGCRVVWEGQEEGGRGWAEQQHRDMGRSRRRWVAEKGSRVRVTGKRSVNEEKGENHCHHRGRMKAKGENTLRKKKLKKSKKARRKERMKMKKLKKRMKRMKMKKKAKRVYRKQTTMGKMRTTRTRRWVEKRVLRKRRKRMSKKRQSEKEEKTEKEPCCIDNA
jgi:hypothetical protein